MEGPRGERSFSAFSVIAGIKWSGLRAKGVKRERGREGGLIRSRWCQSRFEEGRAGRKEECWEEKERK